MSNKDKDHKKALDSLKNPASNNTNQARELPACWKQSAKEKGLDESRIDKFRDYLGHFQWPTGAERGDSYGRAIETLDTNDKPTLSGSDHLEDIIEDFISKKESEKEEQ